ncbi:MAG TPA: hypothetical protein VFM54_01290 [Micromonosporaceae bacterium]|nr:hypothetical protein [Micromonosporaceae bacterium]
MNSRPIRPSRLWYAVAGVLLAGAVTCVVLGVLSLVSLPGEVRQFQRVTVPGQTQVTFTEPGTYVVYLEGPGLSEAPASGTVNVLIQPASNGPPVEVRRSQGSSSYSMAGHEGRSVGSFRVDQPGTYWLIAGPATDSGITHVAVGRGLARSMALPFILLPVGLLLLGPAALVVAVVTAVFRYRARRAPPTPPANVWPAPVTMPGTQWRPH